MPVSKRPQPELVAAVDLGSNSFHMIVARRQDGEFAVIDKLREAVRLGDGINSDGTLSDDSQQRALECLRKFGQRIKDIPLGSVRAVGTNTLRNTSNAEAFLHEAQTALGHPIDIIAGVEEARLIYLGVAQSLAADYKQRFVMDIGGGSTELIIGTGMAPQWVESLEIGCISMTRRYFEDGTITGGRLKKARLHTLMELEPHIARLRRIGWEVAIGASGSIRSAASVILATNPNGDGLTLNALNELLTEVGRCKHIDELKFQGLSQERRPVFVGGLIILQAVMDALDIDRMAVSDGAIREGLLYDLLGRIHNEDVRGRSVANLATRYHVDEHHVERIKETVLEFAEQVADAWELGEENVQWLAWAAQLHEIGLDIAHSRHHHHAAYVIANADLPGFSRQEQQLLAEMIRAHRRKPPAKPFREFPKATIKLAKRLTLLLRLAVILHRARSDQPLPAMTLTAANKSLHIHFPADWLEQHPLTHTDLEQEASYLEALGYALSFD